MASDTKKTDKMAESAGLPRSNRRCTSRTADKGQPNEYSHLRDDIHKIWTSWVENNTNTSDVWRRVEQSGLDNAAKKISTTRPDLSAISGVSSDDAVHITSVMMEFCEMLNFIRQAFVDNEKEIFDSDEHEKRYLTTTCLTMMSIWTSYITFAAEFASRFIETSWLNSSEHRELLSSVTGVAASSVQLLVTAVNMDNYHSLDDADNVLQDAIQETVAVSKETECFLGKFMALGDNHAALDDMTELLGWMLYGLNHMSKKVIKVGIEARAPENNFDDYSALVESIKELTKQMQAKWGEPPTEDIPPPQPSQNDKKAIKRPSPKQTKIESSKETRIEEPDDDKNTKEEYLDILQKYREANGKFSEEMWKSQRLPSIKCTAGVQIKYRTECYDQLGKIRVDACAMTQRKTLLDGLELTDDYILHADLFIIDPEPLNCTQDVTIHLPLLRMKTQGDDDIYLKLKTGGQWNDIANPEIMKVGEQRFIVFNTMSCEAFTAMSFCKPDEIVATAKGANYVNQANGKIEVLVPEDCFSGDVTLTVKTIAFDKSANDNTFVGIVNASTAVQIATQTKDAEMKKHVTVQLPIDGDVDDKDTELVVARSNGSEVQVLDKRQISVKATDRNGVYTVDIKGFWCVAVLRIKRIFLNMREAIKREFQVAFGIKERCTILTFIDDLSRGEEIQTFVMEVVEKDDVEATVDVKRQAGLLEVKKSRSKDILVRRGDQILMQVDGQMRCSEASSDEDQTVCFLNGCSNVVSIATEIKRDPEKMPDAMIFYKQEPNDVALHSMAIMTRDLSELATEQITARSGTNSNLSDSKRGKYSEDSAVHILKMESLMSLARELTCVEGSCLGQQLGVKPETIRQIQESTDEDPVATNFQILCRWRGRSARATMADFLVSSLKAVGKINYARLVMEVRKHNRGLERTDFQQTKGRRKMTA